jgi:hypothetical protein
MFIDVEYFSTISSYRYIAIKYPYVYPNPGRSQQIIQKSGATSKM